MSKGIVGNTLRITLILILLACGVVYAQRDETNRAVVVSVDGYVDVRPSGEDTFAALTEGTRVGPGDLIETGDEGKVELMLPDKSRLVVGEKSRIVIKELGVVEVTKVSTSAFELIKGKIRAIVAPFIGKESSFTIETTNATVGVRGTDFGETYDPDTGLTYVLGIDGSVTITAKNAPGTPSITLTKGQYMALTGGQWPPASGAATDEIINQFLQGMGTTGEEGAGAGAEVEPPFITGVFINRVINLEDIEGTLTLTRDDLGIDGKVAVSGGAVDEAYTVSSVEVSLDRGTTWTSAEGTTSWSFKFAPQENTEYELTVRATNDKGAVSDPMELGSWAIVYEDTDFETIARSQVDKLFSYIRTGDSSVTDLISDDYDGVVNGAYSKSEVVDKITEGFEHQHNITINYTINQISPLRDAVIVTTRWSATVGGTNSEGQTKFWLSKADNFRFIHAEGNWFAGMGEPGELVLEVVPNGYLPVECSNSLRIILKVPDVPSNVNTITVYPVTTCENAHFAILTRIFYEDMTGKTDGFGGDFHYERIITACTASGSCPAMPFLYRQTETLVTVSFTEYGYNLKESISMP
jgi:hypothetical protein